MVEHVVLPVVYSIVHVIPVLGPLVVGVVKVAVALVVG
jgi:hypothetical protein